MATAGNWPVKLSRAVVSFCFKLCNLLLIGALVTTCSCSRAQIPEPALTIDLGAINEFAEARAKDSTEKVAVQFVDERHIIVGILLRGILSGEVGSASLGKSSSTTFVFAVNAQTGRIEANRRWTRVGLSPLTLGSSRGAALISSDGQLMRLSGNLSELQRRDGCESAQLNANGTTSTIDWVLAVDPNGLAAMLIQPTGGSGSPIIIHWLSPESLKDEDVEPLNDYWGGVMIGQALVFSDDEAVLRKLRDRMPEVLCTCSGDAVVGAFGHDKVVLATEPGVSYKVIDLSGKVLHRQTDDKTRGAMITHVAGASEANRFAFDFSHVFSSLLGWRQSSDVRVFDADQNREIWSMHGSDSGEHIGPYVQQFTLPSLALSPSWRTLAASSGSNAQIYRLP